MLYNIYKITLVLLLCGVIYCNTLYEKRLSDVEVQLSEMKEEFGGRFEEMKERFEKMEKDIQSTNDAVTRLVFTLLEGNSEVPKKSHVVKKREVVVSSNPLTNLPLGELAGLRGAPGKDGVPGRDGRDGIQGLPGTNGLPGAVGPAGPRGKDGTSAEAGGAVYTRWGRTTCGSNSQILYSGYAGGSHWNRPGGGVNYQCMPLDPQYNRFYTGHGANSYMTAVEYETYKFGIFADSAHNQNAPCARCYTNNRSAVMMIPAKRDCSEGWNKEYEGYLMTQFDHDNHQTTFECVDASPEYINGESADTNGAFFQFIKTQCNTHCPPYDGNKQITCVICSK